MTAAALRLIDLVWHREPNGDWRAVSDESGAEYLIEKRAGARALLFDDGVHVGTYRTIGLAKAAAFDRDYVLGAA